MAGTLATSSHSESSWLGSMLPPMANRHRQARGTGRLAPNSPLLEACSACGMLLQHDTLLLLDRRNYTAVTHDRKYNLSTQVEGLLAFIFWQGPLLRQGLRSHDWTPEEHLLTGGY